MYYWTKDEDEKLLEFKGLYKDQRDKWVKIKDSMNTYHETTYYTKAIVRNRYLRLTVDEEGDSKEQKIGGYIGKKWKQRCRTCGKMRRGHVCDFSIEKTVNQLMNL